MSHFGFGYLKQGGEWPDQLRGEVSKHRSDGDRGESPKGEMTQYDFVREKNAGNRGLKHGRDRRCHTAGDGDVIAGYFGFEKPGQSRTNAATHVHERAILAH